MSLREDVLKQLALDYQEAVQDERQGRVTFEKVLKRVDRLLLKTIYKHMKRRPYLRKIEFEDLYHSAIVGLGRAFLTVKPTEGGNKVVARIVAYVRNEINTNFPLNTKNQFFNFKWLEDFPAGFGDKCIEGDAEKSAEYSLLQDNFRIMIEEGIITLDDVGLLAEKFLRGKTNAEMAKSRCCTHETIRDRMERILNRVHGWCERDGKKTTKV